MKTKLVRLNQLIARFSKLVSDYPGNVNYKNSLAQLEQERAELVQKIGRVA